MKVWITKYALTEGILEIDAERTDQMVGYRINGGMMQYAHKEGKDWHLLKQSAINRAEVMRKAKIISVEKQLKHLREMRFDKK